MMRFLTVVLLAIVAGLVAVEVTSEKGIRGLDQTARHAFGLPEGRAIAANFKSVGIEGADVSANVSQVAAEAKAKFAEVAPSTNRIINVADNFNFMTVVLK